MSYLKTGISLTLILSIFYMAFTNQTVLTNNVEEENPFYALGYTDEDLNQLKQVITEEDFDHILTEQIEKDTLMPYLNHQYFQFNRFEQYEAIRNTRQMGYIEAVNRINHPYLTSEFYKHQNIALNLNTPLVLVNKNYGLNEDYEPTNLVFCENINLIIPTQLERNSLKQEVYLEVKNLFYEANRRGLMLFLSNGYRSYFRQNSIYNQYLLDGLDPDRFSAKPGFSEHQTGLALDVTAKSVDFFLEERFEETPEGQFIKDNAHKYGFIIRYPKNKEHITGYRYEPWHIRYVGKEVAKIIYEENLTLEEYLLKYTQIEVK